MIRWMTSGAVVGSLLVACQPSTPTPPPKSQPVPLAVDAPPPKPLTSADEVCTMLFGAPRRHLAASCSVHEERTKAFTELDELAGKRLADCVETLSPGMKAGRIRVSRQDAEACATQIQSAGWRESLRDANIARFTSCAGLFSGAQGAGESCGLSLECSPGLVCESDGKCQRRTAKNCDAPDSWLFGEQAAQCGAEAYCAGMEHAQPTHHVGLSPRPRFREAAEFGMIGTLNQTGPIGDSFGAGSLGLSGVGKGGGGVGEGIGLGSIGTIGHGAGKPGTKPPRVRLAKPSASKRLPPAVIQRVVRSNFGRFRVCYQAGLKDNPRLKGKVTVRFVISRDGTVSSASGKSDMHDKRVASCVTRAFYSLSFPKPKGGIVTVSYPIVFTPSGDSSDASPPPALAEKPKPTRLTCEPRRKTGNKCEHASQCATRICRAGRCSEDLGRDGDACHGDGECEPHLYCGEPLKCEPLLEAGQACDYTSECEGACVDNKCASLCGAG